MLTYNVFDIDDGVNGTQQTLAAMADLCMNAQLVPITRHTALRILNAAMCQDRIDYGKAVWRWVRRRVCLVDEPVELIQPPEFLLSQLQRSRTVAGDCDDATTLAAALITAIGVPVRLVAVKTAGSPYFQHVFCEMLAAGSWWAVDPTVVAIPAGDFDRLVWEV